MIVNVSINKIYPHPDNPRKDVGDVTELSESIKKNGIMQNLTIIPECALTEDVENQPKATEVNLNGKFYALIGHRRLAGAKLAELTEVPCQIRSKISKREQVSIMLEENMQRNDLTIYEQAQGFQMMLDLGETADTIAEKTGFSKSTIYHRLNIAKLDEKVLKKKNDDDSFQLSLKDLYALEQIEDIKVRNKILKEADDSKNLKWRAEQAVRDIKREKRKKEIIAFLKEKGVQPFPKKESRYNGKWEQIKYFTLDGNEKLTLKKLDDLYYEDSYGWIYVLHKKKVEKKKLTPEEQRRAEREKEIKQLKAQIKQMAAVRKDFAKSVANGKIEMLKTKEILESIWDVILSTGYGTGYNNVAAVYLDFNYWGHSEEEHKQAYKKACALSAEQTMLIAMLLVDLDLVQYNNTYNKERGKIMVKMYKILEQYGLRLEDEEKQIIEGTHEKYEKEK
ncbi:MAG: ParB/RepB/Spo0J family partition protein [Lachnospiraceae bacterium]|nr:ParB/RepB/Spo0J family partition protein [Lachnospiraceae bacterium]